ncbi:MAG: glucoamylase family protein [Candidatus Izemoplasmatales bacterium]
MNLIERELRQSFDFFWEQANRDPDSPGYGLVVDDTGKPDIASIASVGFGLSAIVIGVENGYITRAEGLDAARRTLSTFVSTIPEFKGFFMHFTMIRTGLPRRKCEYSTIDTAIFLNGALTCDAYFDDAEIRRLFRLVYDRVDWNAFVFDYKGNPTFRMAYNPEEGGDYRQHSRDPWIWQWEMTAEQLSLYFLAAGSDAVPATLAKALYDGFRKPRGSYAGIEYVYSPGNALFVYQYSHAWIDFSRILDADGFDWAENTRRATYANREWCIRHADRHPIFGEDMWGITACLTPKGYRNQGALPTDLLDHPDGHTEGVVPPSGPAGSICFAPEIVIPALEHMAKTYPAALGRYGFTDGIALTKDGPWVAKDYIGINKGITVLMLDNYLHGTIWKLTMNHPLIRRAIAKLGFTER